MELWIGLVNIEYCFLLPVNICWGSPLSRKVANGPAIC
jgi:hypothetical protein